MPFAAPHPSRRRPSSPHRPAGFLCAAWRIAHQLHTIGITVEFGRIDKSHIDSDGGALAPQIGRLPGDFGSRRLQNKATVSCNDSDGNGRARQSADCPAISVGDDCKTKPRQAASTLTTSRLRPSWPIAAVLRRQRSDLLITKMHGSSRECRQSGIAHAKPQRRKKRQEFTCVRPAWYRPGSRLCARTQDRGHERESSGAHDSHPVGRFSKRVVNANLQPALDAVEPRHSPVYGLSSWLLVQSVVAPRKAGQRLGRGVALLQQIAAAGREIGPAVDSP